ncbi:C40 family peptidase [Robertkochia marina]|nr:C40 family peptidase [Robertkochia marina]
MRAPIITFIVAAFLVSCGSSKRSAESNRNHVRIMADNQAEVPVTKEIPNDASKNLDVPEIHPLVNGIINTALSYNGTRYKYGGTSKKGMDCSGLIYTSFQSADIPLQRSSAAMATQGEPVEVTEVKKGDLLFFTTGRSNERINHVGLVVEVNNDNIRFIHATTSRGVMVSSLREGYWNHAFHHARRIL